MTCTNAVPTDTASLHAAARFSYGISGWRDWAKGMKCLGVARLERRPAIVKCLEQIGAP